MASTGFSSASPPGGLHPTNYEKASYSEKQALDSAPGAPGIADEEASPYSPRDSDELKPSYDFTHRKLKPRHIQLIGIGG